MFKFNDFVKKQKWITARAKRNPHQYCLRKNNVDEDFVNVVKFIRIYGKLTIFWNKPYCIYEFKGYQYWTMGCPLNNCNQTGTILINRAKIGGI